MKKRLALILCLLVTVTFAEAIQKVPLWQTAFPSNTKYYAIGDNTDNGEQVVIDLDSLIETNASNILTNTSNILSNTSNSLISTSNILVNTSNILVNTSNILVNTSNIVVLSKGVTNVLTTNVTFYIEETTPNTEDRLEYVYSLMDGYIDVNPGVIVTYEFGPGTFYLSKVLLLARLAPSSGCTVIVKGAVSASSPTSVLYFYTGSEGIRTEARGSFSNPITGVFEVLPFGVSANNNYVLGGGLDISGLAGSTIGGHYGILSEHSYLVLYAPLSVRGFSSGCIIADGQGTISIRSWVMGSDPRVYIGIHLYGDDAESSCDGLVSQYQSRLIVRAGDGTTPSVYFETDGNGSFEYHSFVYSLGSLYAPSAVFDHTGNATTDSTFWTAAKSFGIAYVLDTTNKNTLDNASTSTGIIY
jgi:hypothetical protein